MRTNFDLFFILILLFYQVLQRSDPLCCNGVSHQFIDDDELTVQLSRVRSEFLSTRPFPKFDRLDVTLLLPTDSPKVFRRASFRPSFISYSASTVKAPFAVAAMWWCRERQMKVDCLDRHVRPMVVVSDNLETGIVVDIITNQTNIEDLNSTDDPRFATFLERRKYTHRILEKFKLLSNQIVMSKTYPSNSGWPLTGAEKVQREYTGSNALQPCCMATFLLDMLTGVILPEPKEESIRYAKSLLFHQIMKDEQSSFGFGLPPGTILENKMGNAYDTTADVAHIVLPNKKEFYLAAYSSGLQRVGIDEAQLGIFVEQLIYGVTLANLSQGLQTQFHKVSDSLMSHEQLHSQGQTNVVANYTLVGNWVRGTEARDKQGSFYLTHSTSEDGAAEVHWNVEVMESGLHSVYAYAPTVPMATAYGKVLHRVKHAQDSVEEFIDQSRSSRWHLIGDYHFKKGFHRDIVVISNKGPKGSIVIVNSLKLSRYPHCNGIPGNVC